jgi:hypothetical protein
MTPKEKKEILSQADKEIDAFEKWFLTTGAGSLSKFERAILKTYVVAKVTNQFEVPYSSTEPGPCRLS